METDTRGHSAHPGTPGLPRLIRALCPNCREVEIAAAEARLEVVRWNEEGTCRFTCPSCGTTVVKPVAPPLVHVLIRMGVPYDHPGHAPPAAPPPLTQLDIERFLEELAGYEG